LVENVAPGPSLLSTIAWSLLSYVSSEEVKQQAGSPDVERGDFFAIQQLVDYLPNGKLIKLEVNRLQGARRISFAEGRGCKPREHSSNVFCYLWDNHSMHSIREEDGISLEFNAMR